MRSEPPRPSALNTWIYDSFATARSRLPRTLFSLARRAAVHLGDQPVAYRMGQDSLSLPLSHQLPYYQRIFPHYDRALPRLAAHQRALDTEAEFVIVDIGANVGDTAVPLLQIANTFVIAVDGNEAYTPFLRHNLRNYQDRTAIFERYIGPPEREGFLIESARGTAHLARSEDGAGVKLVSLDQILAESGKPKVDLIKIDTDGFDIEIIRDSLQFLASGSATIFFEFQPAFFEKISTDGWNVFQELAGIGYGSAIVYLNTGEFVRTFALADRGAILELRALLGSADQTAYLDFAVYKGAETFEHCRDREIEHFTG